MATEKIHIMDTPSTGTSLSFLRESVEASRWGHTPDTFERTTDRIFQPKEMYGK